MRTDLDSVTQALLEGGDYDAHWFVSVENGSGTAIDLSDRIEAISGTLPSPDQPIATLDVTFVRELNEDGAGSLAPLMGASDFNRLDDETTYSALLLPGRDVVAKLALTSRGGPRPISSAFYEIFRGKVEGASSPEQYGPAAIHCLDQSGALQRTKAEAERVYASGTPIETAIQSVLNDNGFSSITLNVPTATDAVLGADYRVAVQKPVWEVVWGLAQSIGWVVWWRYQSDGSAKLTLFEPDRDIATSSFTIPVVRQITQLDINGDEIGNVLYGEYSDSEGARQMEGPVEDTDSITKYGKVRRSFWISEPEDSPIRSQSDMAALLQAALSDLSEPDAIQAATLPLFAFGEASVDAYTFSANSFTYDDDQLFAPFAVSFEHRVGQDHQTIMRTRGKPTAGAKVWKGRGGINRTPPVEPPEVYGFTSFVRRNKETTVEFEFTVGSKVSEVWWVANEYAQDDVPANPYPDKDDPDLSAYSVLVVGTDTLQVSIDIPDFGNVKYAQFEARKEDLSFGPGNNVMQVEIQPNKVDTPGILDAAITAIKVANEAIEQAKIKQRAVGTNQLELAGVARDNIAAKAINAALLDDDILDLTAFSRVVANNAIIGDKLSVSKLSEIADDCGIVVSGELRNALGTRYIDLDATGTDPFIAHDKFEIRADGTAIFTGELIAATGTFTGSLTSVDGTFTGELVSVNGSFTGELIAATGTFVGELTAATGTFAGDITAATGTFSGTVASTSFTASIAEFSGVVDVVSGTDKVRITHSLVNIIDGGTTVGQYVWDGTKVSLLAPSSDLLVHSSSGDVSVTAGNDITIDASGDLTLEASGALNLNVTTSASGGTTAGYIVVNINGVQKKIAYHNNS